MNFNHLRVFHAVVDHGSITAAARALHISQPAVSKQLAELEASVGASLVDRLHKGTRLTAAGELLAEHVRRIFQEEHAAESALEEFLGLRQGRLSIGASTTIGSYLVPSVFGDFSREYPQVAMELQIGNTSAIQSAVLAGQLDLGLIEGFAAAEALDVEVFAQDEMVLIAGPDSAWASKPMIQASDLPELPFVVRERGSGTREVIEAALAERGIVLCPVMSLGSTEAVKNAVACGLGVAMVSRLTVLLELEVGRLREVKIEDLTIRRSLRRLTLLGKQPSPAAREFLRLLEQRYSPAALG